jgi:hypothetical protein
MINGTKECEKMSYVIPFENGSRLDISGSYMSGSGTLPGCLASALSIQYREQPKYLARNALGADVPVAPNKPGEKGSQTRLRGTEKKRRWGEIEEMRFTNDSQKMKSQNISDGPRAKLLCFFCEKNDMITLRDND